VERLLAQPVLGATHEPDNETDDDQRTNESISKHISLQLLLNVKGSTSRVLFRFEQVRKFRWDIEGYPRRCRAEP
jgi:hypothetical protein